MPTSDRGSPLVRLKRRLRPRTRVRAAVKAMRSRPAGGRQPRDLDLLLAAPLFDVEWYAAVAGCPPVREAAVQDYLTRGHALGLPPHPLFDPEHYTAQLGAAGADDRPAFAAYLSAATSTEVSPHPLFDAAAYTAAVPAAARHPYGALGHYVARGAAAGARPNDWYVPDPQREPGGLADWVRARRVEWQQRQETAAPRLLPEPPAAAVERFLREHGDDVVTGAVAAADPAAEPLVSVVLVVGGDLTLLADMVAGVRDQTLGDWELLVLHHQDRDDVLAALGDAVDDERVRLVGRRTPALAPALDDGLRRARGTYLAWLHGGDDWAPDYLSRAVGLLRATGAGAVHTAVAVPVRARKGTKTKPPRAARTDYVAEPATPERLAAGLRLDLSALVVARSLALDVGGFDQSVRGAADHDFVLRLARRTALSFIPVVGVTRHPARRGRDAVRYPRRERPLVDHDAVDSWHDVALNRHVVDWAAVEARHTTAGAVSVVIPTYEDWAMTTQAVRTVADAAAVSDLRVQTIVVDNGCAAGTSAVLDSLPLRFPDVEVLHSPVNHGFALGNNLALERVTGDVVVFLNNDTEVRTGWLEPLVAALQDPDVLAAQSLLLYPTGSVQSAGIAFPSCGGVPHALLQGFPVEDAAGIENAELSALTGAALALRRTDVVALRGFDPLFRNGMEDVDLGLRLRRLRPGRCTVRPDSVVVHHESRTAGRFGHALTNRLLFLDRWGADLPGDDAVLWRHVGFEIVARQAQPLTGEERRLGVLIPVLARRPRAHVTEGVPSLRWAIKNPAPADETGELWGDTHFARRLAVALRTLGQQVVIDHRPEFERATAYVDDVSLVLRGVAPYAPAPGHVTLGWLISHPEMLRRSEAESYDRLLAASVTWSDRMSREWGIRIDPLLQATDPELFHPDTARPDTGHPVLFVGGSRKLLRPLVRDAVELGLPLSVYGPGWEGLVPARYVKAQYHPNDTLGAAYRSAGIVLNDHWDHMRVEGFVSNRLFDAAASGARVVTDDVAGLDDLFGRSVQAARDAADLARLATAPDLDAVFGDDAERRAVAARVHAEHSFDVRARQLLDVALEVRASLSASRRAGEVVP